MPDYNSLRQLMGVGFLPQPSAPPYPDFAQQGTPSGGTMQPMPPSGGYGGWGRSPDVLGADQLAEIGKGWNPQPQPRVDPGFGHITVDPAFDAFYEQQKAQGMDFPQIMDAWNAQKQSQPNGGKMMPTPDVMQPWGPGANAPKMPGSWNTQMPAQQPQQAMYDPYRPWGRR